MDERRTLRDDDGREVARFVTGTWRGHRLADDLLPGPGVPPADVAAAVLCALPGWAVCAQEREGRALAAAGAVSKRHAHCYTWDLAARPPDPSWARPALPAGVTLAPAVDREPADLTATWIAAYPPGHPDNPRGETFDSAREQLATLYDGSLIGALMPASCVLQDGSRPVAVCLVNDRPGDPPLLGPWITEVFRDPDPAYAGLGATALRATLARAAADGVPTVGLTVTEGNPARATYEKVGFTHTESTMTLLVPETP
ncbi:GNAT family N-acetyltransferase [Yinghuangia sp. YIM S09857]|uniref:GNAT family N-acetyltransferase n=1 Tax=Yinghuangia sp. YIM S09857 TaxID=3436929 RepID=UPI003F538910